MTERTFFGFRRENGRVGVRNHTILLPLDGTGYLNVNPVSFFANADDIVEGDVTSTLTWTSDPRPGVTYSVLFSDDMATPITEWADDDDGVECAIQWVSAAGSAPPA